MGEWEVGGWAGWAIAYPVSWGVGKNPAE